MRQRAAASRSEILRENSTGERQLVQTRLLHDVTDTRRSDQDRGAEQGWRFPSRREQRRLAGAMDERRGESDPSSERCRRERIAAATAVRPRAVSARARNNRIAGAALGSIMPTSSPPHQNISAK